MKTKNARFFGIFNDEVEFILEKGHHSHIIMCECHILFTIYDEYGKINSKARSISRCLPFIHVIGYIII